MSGEALLLAIMGRRRSRSSHRLQRSDSTICCFAGLSRWLLARGTLVSPPITFCGLVLLCLALFALLYFGLPCDVMLCSLI